MSIPRQVLRDAAAADAALDQMRNAATPPADEPPTPEPPKPAPPPPPAPVVEDWKARHDVAAHKVSVLEGITRTQGDEIKGLHAQVKQLRADIEAAKAVPAKPAPDLSDYDPKLLEAIDHKVGEQVAQTKRKLEDLEAERAARAEADRKAADERTRKSEFADFMDEFVPDWLKIDNEPAFASWLTSVNPATGQQWQAAYMDAVNRIDGRAMARVFNAFKAAAVPATPPPTPPAPPVVPPVSGRAEAADVPQGRIWTQKEIDEHYDGVLRGRLKARGWTEKRIAEVDADILAAYLEGRVRH